MSEDHLQDAYEKYIATKAEEPPLRPETEIFRPESQVPCKKCGSDNVDRTRGYRGEYKCMDCGYVWQVGGSHARG